MNLLRMALASGWLTLVLAQIYFGWRWKRERRVMRPQRVWTDKE